MFFPAAIIDMLQRRAAGDGLWLPSSYPRGGGLLDQGAARDSLFVLISGLVKLTYLSAEGDEWIKSLIVDTGLFGALGSEAGSRFGASAIEPSVVVELPASWIGAAMAADIGLAAQAGAFNAWLVGRKQAREEALLCQSAEARYRTMLATEPALVARLPQGDIARYLRITPIAFSRIKRRMRGNGQIDATGI
ncbi:Crp/Fnr family transcriptional regulator [Sphingomonas radiodurans]|uniref:Crp/Fnr family transcriptional regulator n=1 Tax=Sphingomonas radiodurans TaxID=2890321 RepID=UPI001E5085DC|nr:Crp/Fnr family transcriptional regulator [Sphingomonas radiodurans]WBH16796.1 Crp/Fnr family transcriptional regulator [Sphingomonas radiodurans]